MSHIFLLDTGALKTTGGKAEVPALDKEGWLRPLRKCREASLAGADGVVGSSHRLSVVERTTPAPPPKERDHLLDGAATPPLPRSIQSCPAGQLHNRKEVGGTKTKNLSAYFLERGLRSCSTFVPHPPCLSALQHLPTQKPEFFVESAMAGPQTPALGAGNGSPLSSQ